MSAKRFRIAFSFAGEKRDFVSNVAGILADRFGKEKILYDKYHEAEFAVYNLGTKLPKLYGEESDLIVPVISEGYDQKHWTGWEWSHIAGLLKEEDGHRVMLSRFDHANAEGLSAGSAYIELDDKTPEQFAALILQRLALNEGLPADHYTKTPATTIPTTSLPHNLPTLQPFFGREDELRKIADALDPASRTWGALIDGPGGMGKTSLAVRAAYAVSPDAFARIVFVSLKTRELDDDGLRDLSGFILSGLAELFGELARQLGCDDILNQPDDQRPRLLLDALSGTRTLLVLDNLENLTEQEREFVLFFVEKLPQGCKAILTSRRREGSRSEELNLGKLSESAALNMLADLATHNPLLAQTSEAERLVLYRETGGQPLLLRWTAGQLGRGHSLTIADAIAYLRSSPEGNDPLEFILGDLIEKLTNEERKVLLGLGAFSTPATASLVAAATGISTAAVTEILQSLEARSVVSSTANPTEFSLMPLVDQFLQKHDPAESANMHLQVAAITARSGERAAPLRLYFDGDYYSPAEIAELLGYLSDYYYNLSGDHLEIDGRGVLENCGIPLPVEA